MLYLIYFKFKETEIELEECYRAIEEVQSYLRDELKIDKAETYYYIQFYRDSEGWISSSGLHGGIAFGYYHDSDNRFVYGWVKFSNTYTYENIYQKNELLTINIPWVCFDTKQGGIVRFHHPFNTQTLYLDTNNTEIYKYFNTPFRETGNNTYKAYWAAKDMKFKLTNGTEIKAKDVETKMLEINNYPKTFKLIEALKLTLERLKRQKHDLELKMKLG